MVACFLLSFESEERIKTCRLSALVGMHSEMLFCQTSVSLRCKENGLISISSHTPLTLQMATAQHGTARGDSEATETCFPLGESITGGKQDSRGRKGKKNTVDIIPFLGGQADFKS